MWVLSRFFPQEKGVGLGEESTFWRGRALMRERAPLGKRALHFDLVAEELNFWCSFLQSQEDSGIEVKSCLILTSLWRPRWPPTVHTEARGRTPRPSCPRCVEGCVSAELSDAVFSSARKIQGLKSSPAWSWLQCGDLGGPHWGQRPHTEATMPQVCFFSPGLGEECVVPPWPWYGGGGWISWCCRQMGESLERWKGAGRFWRAPFWWKGRAPLMKRARPFAFGRQGLKPLGVLVISSFSLMQLRVDENQIRSRWYNQYWCNDVSEYDVCILRAKNVY
jgi:hypothetical protein